MLLYAFYLQVADCTIASYFYFGLALRAALILGWHVDADKENLNRFELEHRRRIWWTVYMYERMLSSKAGLPLSFADDSVSTELPIDFKIDLTDFLEMNTMLEGIIFSHQQTILTIVSRLPKSMRLFCHRCIPNNRLSTFCRWLLIWFKG